MKKILIIVSVIAAILVIAVLYLNNRNRTLSPPAEASLKNAGMEATLKYSRPSVRDRLIFGEKEEGALQPYGVYWRLGANEPTILEVSEDFEVDGQELPAGSYTLYAVPRKGEMELILNSEIKFWGVMEPEKTNDVATYVTRMKRIEKVEQFTVTMEPLKKGVNVVFQWDTYRWELPLTK